ncbi:MAG TPA: cytidine deaminase [Syntrophomonadaceae bacterium]|nr:cytidine deaminase [Syntrophomonadaceae bacterium]HNX29224.1 cytidine deaminase [Syntrophomonadaceae bacterium]HPR92592.1 cytidine deaminase [Syntrophomonadaceae bacterium]
MTPEKLVAIAREVQQNSYSPYSGFKVGAALLTTGGNIYTGVNVENASYGLTICAERVAIYTAIVGGEKEFSSITVVGDNKGYTYPCGACMQVMAEFSPNMRVVVTDGNNNYKEYFLRDLLPQLFSLENQEV